MNHDHRCAVEHKGREKFDTTCIETIARVGHMIIGVMGDEYDPPFSYTVGLSAKTPIQRELIVVGLPVQVAHYLLNHFAKQLKAGEEFTYNEDIAKVLKVPVRMHPVSAERFAPYGTYANWYAHDILKSPSAPRAIQVLWPDKFGMWPGTPGFVNSKSQPIV